MLDIQIDDGNTHSVLRLVPLDTWIYENRHVLRAWRSTWYAAGKHSVSGPDNVPRWLRRHEKRLTAAGVVMRIGKAWRLIESRLIQIIDAACLSICRDALAPSRDRLCQQFVQLNFCLAR